MAKTGLYHLTNLLMKNQIYNELLVAWGEEPLDKERVMEILEIVDILQKKKRFSKKEIFIEF